MPISGLFRRKSEPLIINDPLGKFTLRNPKKDNTYESEIDWLGTEVIVDLETDSPHSPTADAALKSLRKIADETAQWDRRLRQYAAEAMCDEEGKVEIWERDEDSDEGIT